MLAIGCRVSTSLSANVKPGEVRTDKALAGLEA